MDSFDFPSSSVLCDSPEKTPEEKDARAKKEFLAQVECMQGFLEGVRFALEDTRVYPDRIDFCPPDDFMYRRMGCFVLEREEPYCRLNGSRADILYSSWNPCEHGLHNAAMWYKRATGNALVVVLDAETRETKYPNIEGSDFLDLRDENGNAIASKSAIIAKESSEFWF